MLVDTAIWIDHLAKGHAGLIRAIEQELVQLHPMVIGELATGSLPRRKQTLTDLWTMPIVRPATDEDVQEMIEARRLWGRGLSYVDCHLLAACLIRGAELWTTDRRLAEAAGELGCRFGK